MEENKSNGVKALEKFRNNLTEEEKKDMYKRAGRTRRKNTCDERRTQKAIIKLLEQKWRYTDLDGNEVIGTGTEAVVSNLLRSALEPNGRNVVSAFKEIRDTIGEKPIDKVETDNTVEIIMSEEMKKLAR